MKKTLTQDEIRRMDETFEKADSDHCQNLEKSFNGYIQAYGHDIHAQIKNGKLKVDSTEVKNNGK